MLELRIIAGRHALPVYDLPAALGRQGAAREIGDQIEALIAFMDDLGGDVDLEEDNEDGEHDGAEPDEDAQGDTAWIEWHTRGGSKVSGEAEVVARDRYGWALHEDAEDDDPPEDDDSDRCLAGDDQITSGAVYGLNVWETCRDQIGDDVDAEPNGDVELNGDESDHTIGSPE